jgi:hypothetical protein
MATGANSLKRQLDLEMCKPGVPSKKVKNFDGKENFSPLTSVLAFVGV